MTSSPKGREGFLKSDIKSTNYRGKDRVNYIKIKFCLLRYIIS